MNYKIASWLIFLLSLSSIYLAFRLYRRGKLTTQFLVFWEITWLAMGFFAIYPRGLEFLGRLISMRDRRTFLFVTSITLLYVLNFRLTSKITALEQKVTKLTQEYALLKNELQSERSRPTDDNSDS